MQGTGRTTGSSSTSTSFREQCQGWSLGDSSLCRWLGTGILYLCLSPGSQAPGKGRLGIWSCAQTRQLSGSQAELYLPPVMSRECYFFIDLADTALNFGSNSYPGATRSQAGRREPLQEYPWHAHLSLGTPSSSTLNTGELDQHPNLLGLLLFLQLLSQPVSYHQMEIRTENRGDASVSQ